MIAHYAYLFILKLMIYGTSVSAELSQGPYSKHIVTDPGSKFKCWAVFWQMTLSYILLEKLQIDRDVQSSKT